MGSNMSTYASVRFDGSISCTTIRAGIIQTPGGFSPVIAFQVSAGIQTHPVWALDRLAIVVYSYCHAAKRGSMAGTGEFIQVNVEGTLVSGESASISVANSIHWHTSKRVRELAEDMIDEMSNGAFARQWPQISLTLPVEYPAVSGRPGRRSRGSG
jgi:hypothetical protein